MHRPMYDRCAKTDDTNTTKLPVVLTKRANRIDNMRKQDSQNNETSIHAISFNKHRRNTVRHCNLMNPSPTQGARNLIGPFWFCVFRLPRNMSQRNTLSKVCSFTTSQSKTQTPQNRSRKRMFARDWPDKMYYSYNTKPYVHFLAAGAGGG